KRESCTHLHIHFAHVPTDIGMYASLLTGIPFSFTAHANDIFERGWLLREKIARSKFTATISNYNRNWLISKGCQGEKIQIVRCGIDSSRFTPIPLKKIVAPFRIGTIGRMVEKKGFDTLIEAAALLKKKGVDLRLVVAGDGPMRTTLHELVDKLQLQDTVELSGSIANQDVPAWLHTLDLFVLPCREDQNGDMDGIPVVLMEAMLSGIPVISTRISGIPELITDEVSGLLIAPHEPHALARAMERFLLDYELRETTKMQSSKWNLSLTRR
ncbi:MAG: glycosyltransferase, partial [Chlorobium sp.]|nr:glycosyltransferase [Chlorobium sp.]